MSDLAAMSDMDGTTNDDTTSTVLDGCVPDSRHKPAHMDSPGFPNIPDNIQGTSIFVPAKADHRFHGNKQVR
jgi:hypothetical protein